MLRRLALAGTPTSRRSLPIATASRPARWRSDAMPGASIMWFRKGLRLHDNPALLEAASGVDAMYPIFILDPHFVTPAAVGPNRLRFLLDCLADLDASLQARGSRLLVLRGKPADTLPQLFKEWGVTKLCFEADTEEYARERDAAAAAAAKAAGVSVHSPVSHTLYDPADLLRRAGGKPPLTMKSFEKLIEGAGPPPPPAPDPPAALPGPAPSAPRCGPGESLVPGSIAELGYEQAATTPYRGGETVALARLADYLSDARWVCEFEKPKGNPAAFDPRPATTVLSPALKFGCLSARLFHSRLAAVYAGAGGKHTRPPVSLRGQLLWREFFYLAAAGTPNFGRMAGNPVCRQIPWGDHPDRLAAWAEGRTGYPWIDAAMGQLRAEGWMHHLARHSVACFLTRGDLWCSWEAGRDVFDRLLLDADPALNAGNWQWLSASAFFAQYFRVYSPVSFGKQYDKNGDYIRRYVPALAKFPAKYIYEPWTAPRGVQEAAGCVVGRDYPPPIVDHAVAVKENMERMKAAYAAAREGGGGGGSAGAPPAKKAKKG